MSNLQFPPAGYALLQDPRVKLPLVARLYVFLAGRCNTEETQSFRTWWLAEQLGADRSDTSKALRRLVAWGYIAEVVDTARDGRHLKLLFRPIERRSA